MISEPIAELIARAEKINGAMRPLIIERDRISSDISTLTPKLLEVFDALWVRFPPRSGKIRLLLKRDKRDTHGLPNDTALTISRQNAGPDRVLEWVKRLIDFIEENPRFFSIKSAPGAKKQKR